MFLLNCRIIKIIPHADDRGKKKNSHPIVENVQSNFYRVRNKKKKTSLKLLSVSHTESPSAGRLRTHTHSRVGKHKTNNGMRREK